MPQDTVSLRATERAEAVGTIIRNRREALGISLRAFAQQCELSPAHVSKIERGLASPSLVTLTRLVQELHLHGADLFGLATQVGGEAHVVRAVDAPVIQVEGGNNPDGELRIAAQTAVATVLLGAGGPDHFLPPTISARQVISIVLEGAVEAQVGGALIDLQQGDTLIVPPLTPHALRVTGGPCTRTVYITSDESEMVFDAPEPDA